MISVVYEWDSCACGCDASSYTDTGHGATYEDAFDAILADLYDEHYDELREYDDEIEVTFWDDDRFNILADGIVTSSGWQYETQC